MLKKKCWFCHYIVLTVSRICECFLKKKADILFSHQVCNLAIQLKKKFQLSSVFLYNMSHNEIQKLHHYLDENLIKKFIWISCSHIISSVLFAKKSEREFCFCIDYKELNAIIVKNHYLLFLISEILNCLCKTRIYFKLNIIHAFNCLHIWKNDEKLTVFHTYFEFFEYFVVFFDFFNDSVTFQFYINDILWEYLDDFCTVYLDNILIYNKLEMKHEIHVKHIFQKLWEADLQVDVIKYEFHVMKVIYLSLIIITEDICMNSVKIEIIVN